MTATDTTTCAAAPPDLATLRETAQRVLGPDSGPDALPPPADELDTLIAQLRGHLELLTPEVERMAGRLPEASVAGHGAMACAEEARDELRAPDLSSTAPSCGVMYARRLARVLNALCAHYELLGTLGPTGRTPEQTAFLRLAEHCASCRTCRTADETGANAGLPCAESDLLYGQYRQARARLTPARLGSHRRPAEASA
ncbi:DUF6415 family natural product biosynthesis protein [Streptomyces sp. NPDC008137]|uniref:DUF6415 family natural product biosynthesis protein n=1 Tax=Streptomyces sp. NPDC008137 TaxID=3364813 RepID=UPI0036EEA6D3